MRSFRKLIAPLVVSISLIVSGTAFAQTLEQSSRRQPQDCPNTSRYNFREQVHQIAIAVVSELGNQPIKTLSAQMRYKPLWAVLDTYNIDYNIFQATFSANVINLTDQAVANGELAERHANLIKQQMSKPSGWVFPPHRGLPKLRGYQHMAGVPHEANRVPREEFIAAAEVLAEIAGKEQEIVQIKMKYKPLWAILDEYQIDYAVFDERLKHTKIACGHQDIIQPVSKR